MEPPRIFVQDLKRQQAPNVKPLLGSKVKRVWGTPGGTMLAVLLEGGKILMVETNESLLNVTVGDEIPGMDWSAVPAYPDPHARSLVGRRFTGFAANAVTFGKVRAQFNRDSIRWVREP
jgi:hypothetical protein